jgi:hypothetical protein
MMIQILKVDEMILSILNVLWLNLLTDAVEVNNRDAAKTMWWNNVVMTKEN